MQKKEVIMDYRDKTQGLKIVTIYCPVPLVNALDNIRGKKSRNQYLLDILVDNIQNSKTLVQPD